MSIQGIELRIEGTSPLMMHNVRLANPLNKYTKRMAELMRAKKVKGADKEAIAGDLARVEWEGGLYHSATEKGDDGTGPYIPARNMHAAVWEAAKLTKEGQSVVQGVFTGGMFALEYDGPRDVEGLFAAEEFVDLRIIGVNQGSKVLRCRPIFNQWACTVRFTVDAKMCDPARLVDFVRSAGLYKGVCDGHKGVMGMGRFRVVS